jgi:hypothetical protein
MCEVSVMFLENGVDKLYLFFYIYITSLILWNSSQLEQGLYTQASDIPYRHSEKKLVYMNVESEQLIWWVNLGLSKNQDHPWKNESPIHIIHTLNL